jgi:hypothetical protein
LYVVLFSDHRLEEELEGERATCRRLRRERDAVVAKHKQAMAERVTQLDRVAHSIRSAVEKKRHREYS